MDKNRIENPEYYAEPDTATILWRQMCGMPEELARKSAFEINLFIKNRNEKIFNDLKNLRKIRLLFIDTINQKNPKVNFKEIVEYCKKLNGYSPHTSCFQLDYIYNQEFSEKLMNNIYFELFTQFEKMFFEWCIKRDLKIKVADDESLYAEAPLEMKNKIGSLWAWKTSGDKIVFFEKQTNISKFNSLNLREPNGLR